MNSRELVEICNLCDSCKYCYHDKLCEAYVRQFGCHPYEISKIFTEHPEGYSDTIIQFGKGAKHDG